LLCSAIDEGKETRDAPSDFKFKIFLEAGGKQFTLYAAIAEEQIMWVKELQKFQ